MREDGRTLRLQSCSPAAEAVLGKAEARQEWEGGNGREWLGGQGEARWGPGQGHLCGTLLVVGDPVVLVPEAWEAGAHQAELNV